MKATTQSHVALTQTVKQHNSLRRYPLAERKGYNVAALRLDYDSGVSCNSGGIRGLWAGGSRRCWATRGEP